MSFGAFVLICGLLTITPGADTALILNSALKSGLRGVFYTTIGISAGLLFHAALSSLGLSAILQQSAELYSIVKFLGAGYLVYLGLKSLYEAFLKKGDSLSSQTSTEVPETHSRFAAFRIGLLTNILNPKVAVFYMTFLPQFLNPAKNVLLQSLGLASVHVLLSFVWLLLIGRFVTYFKASLSRPKVKKRLEAVTGFALLGFGLKLALSKK